MQPHPNTKLHPNHPWDDVIKRAKEKIKDGIIVYQKFTCEKCGTRQTMPDPNKFYTLGDCEECGHRTDIKKYGCNYMAHFAID